MIPHPNNGYFYIIEGDHRVMSEEAKQKKLEELVSGATLSRRKYLILLIPCRLDRGSKSMKRC